MTGGYSQEVSGGTTDIRISFNPVTAITARVDIRYVLLDILAAAAVLCCIGMSVWTVLVNWRKIMLTSIPE